MTTKISTPEYWLNHSLEFLSCDTIDDNLRTMWAVSSFFEIIFKHEEGAIELTDIAGNHWRLRAERIETREDHR